MDLNDYNFGPLNPTEEITLEEIFIGTYIEDFCKSENICDESKIMRKLLDMKYEKSDLNQVTNNKCQHPTENY